MWRTTYVLDAVLFAVSLFAIMVVARGLALIMPLDFYFTFQSLFSDRAGQNIVVSLFAKMLAPLLCGFTVGWVLHTWATGSASLGSGAVALAREVRRVWSPTMFASGFVAAFLSAWPNIAYWDMVSNPELSPLKGVFFLLYLLYMLAFGYVALLGLLAAIFLRERMAGIGGERQLVGAQELGRVGALWVLNSGIASSMMKYITQ